MVLCFTSKFALLFYGWAASLDDMLDITGFLKHFCHCDSNTPGIHSMGGWCSGLMVSGLDPSFKEPGFD